MWAINIAGIDNDRQSIKVMQLDKLEKRVKAYRLKKAHQTQGG